MALFADKKIMLFALFAIGLSPTVLAQQLIAKCKDSSGKVIYGDASKCMGSDAKETRGFVVQRCDQDPSCRATENARAASRREEEMMQSQIKAQKAQDAAAMAEKEAEASHRRNVERNLWKMREEARLRGLEQQNEMDKLKRQQQNEMDKLKRQMNEEKGGKEYRVRETPLPGVIRLEER